jgi:hypothetical protein
MGGQSNLNTYAPGVAQIVRQFLTSLACEGRQREKLVQKLMLY